MKGMFHKTRALDLRRTCTVEFYFSKHWSRWANIPNKSISTKTNLHRSHHIKWCHQLALTSHNNICGALQKCFIIKRQILITCSEMYVIFHLCTFSECFGVIFAVLSLNRCSISSGFMIFVFLSSSHVVEIRDTNTQKLEDTIFILF